MINGDVTHNTGENDRRVVPHASAMEKNDRRHAREMQQGGHGLHVLMTVNQVWNRGQLIQIVDDCNCGLLKLIGNTPQDGAVDDWRVPTLEQTQRDITHVHFRTVAPGHRVIRNKHSEGSHQNSLSSRDVFAFDAVRKCFVIKTRKKPQKLLELPVAILKTHLFLEMFRKETFSCITKVCDL